MKPEIFYEYERKCFDGIFTQRDLNAIEKLNKVYKCNIFKITRREISATQYVGFVNIRGKIIQIIPKIMKDDRDADLHFLLYMLKYTKKLKVKDFSLNSLKEYNDNFFEIFIWLYCKNLIKLLSYDIKKQYVANEENINFLKGKLLIGNQLKHNQMNTTKYFCSYEEFTEDNPINQILKYVTYILTSVSNDNSNKKYLKQIMAIFENVSIKHVTVSDIDKIHFTRLNEEYRPILNLCRIFLENSTISFENSKIETFAFIFDMNRLFEEFVYEFMRYHKKELNIKNIHGQRLLGKLFDEFNMYYDVLIEDKDCNEIILDTKYKSPEQGKRHSGLSQSDFYQMFAYSQSQDKKYSNIILLYPKASMEEIDLKHENKSTNINIKVRCIELQDIWDVDNKRLIESRLIENLKGCISLDA